MNAEAKEKVNIFVKRIANGDGFAMHGLHEIVSKSITSYIGRFTNDIDVIGEVLDRTLHTISKKAKRLKNFDNCFSWIIKIANNKYLNVSKSSNRHKFREAYIDDMEEFNQPSCKALSHEALAVQELINKLPEEQRRIIYLKFYCNELDKDVMKAMKLSKSTYQRRRQDAYDYIEENF